jgi:hypothetical protein
MNVSELKLIDFTRKLEKFRVDLEPVAGTEKHPFSGIEGKPFIDPFLKRYSQSGLERATGRI